MVLYPSYDGENKKIIGKFKDESQDEVIARNQRVLAKLS